MTSAKQIYLGSRRGPALPYDAEVEYLSNDGSQNYIDMGIYWNRGDTIEIQVAQNVIADQAAFGVALKIYGFSNNTPSNTNNNAFYWGNAPYHGGGTNVLPSNFGTSAHTIRIEEDHADVDGTVISYSQTTDASQSLHTVVLFGRAANTAAMSFTKTWNGKIYYCKYWKSGVLVRDFIPVRFTNEQGVSEGAMYDRASDQLFRNAGTGAFGFGTDIARGGGINV